MSPRVRLDTSRMVARTRTTAVVAVALSRRCHEVAACPPGSIFYFLAASGHLQRRPY